MRKLEISKHAQKLSIKLSTDQIIDKMRDISCKRQEFSRNLAQLPCFGRFALIGKVLCQPYQSIDRGF